MDDYIGTVAICGDEGSGKTSMALTFPKSIEHFDIDVGGYHRASWRLDTEGIRSRSYPKPIQLSKMIGTTQTTSRYAIPKKVEGMKELWQKIIQDYVDACQDEKVKTIVLDSSTLLWTICHSTYLQELQEKQLAQHRGPLPFDENDYRERLQPVEYGTANERMRSVLHTARSYRKNLILTHYPTDEYGVVQDSKGNMVEGKTGRTILDGFKETIKLADLVVWTRVVEGRPMCKITKCGLPGLGLVGVGLEIEATFDSVVNLQQMMGGASA